MEKKKDSWQYIKGEKFVKMAQRVVNGYVCYKQHKSTKKNLFKIKISDSYKCFKSHYDIEGFKFPRNGKIYTLNEKNKTTMMMMIMIKIKTNETMQKIYKKKYKFTKYTVKFICREWYVSLPYSPQT